MDKRKAGLGLGLALVNHIVVLLKGELEIRNVHPGLEVTVTLLRASEAPESRKTKEAVYA